MDSVYLGADLRIIRKWRGETGGEDKLLNGAFNGLLPDDVGSVHEYRLQLVAVISGQ